MNRRPQSMTGIRWTPSKKEQGPRRSADAVPLRPVVGLLLISAILAAFVTGCGPHKVKVDGVGRPDEMSVKLSFRKGDKVRWSNASGQTIEIVFDNGIVSPLQIPPNGVSRDVAVSEFGSVGHYGYKVHMLGAGQPHPQTQPPLPPQGDSTVATATMADTTTTGPGDPDVDAGP